jgi:large conductance mechanosensitive channel
MQKKEFEMLKEFFSFLKAYGVIGLAIAVIIGGKLNELISSLVNDLLMPLLFQPALRAANIRRHPQTELPRHSVR